MGHALLFQCLRSGVVFSLVSQIKREKGHLIAGYSSNDVLISFSNFILQLVLPVIHELKMAFEQLHVHRDQQWQDQIRYARHSSVESIWVFRTIFLSAEQLIVSTFSLPDDSNGSELPLSCPDLDRQWSSRLVPKGRGGQEIYLKLCHF